jgi:hypothetical protein
MPERIQLRRAAGWRKPADAVVVARPTVWGNPFRVDRHRGGGLIWLTYSLGTDDVEELRTVESVDEGRALAVECYERALHAGELLFVPAYARELLAGRDLACWCPASVPCHADVLLRIANEAVGG